MLFAGFQGEDVMRLEHAKLLLDLAETGSFNQTAERLYTTASKYFLSN